MKMNKLLLGLFLTLATSGAAQAASSGNLLLQGTVALVNDIVVNPVVGVNNTLDIVAGETSIVANVDETSNNLTGYKIFISSPTAGELQNTSDITKKTTYTIGYDGAGHVTPTVAPLQVKNVASLSALTTDTSAVQITVTAYPTAPAGTYQDTLTFTIVANP
jgi:hypothetical protein